MSRLLSAVMASVLVLGLTGAMGQALDTRLQKSSDEYKLAKDPCRSPSETGKQQCARDLKATDESSRLRCGKLADQARRECVLEAFVQQHDRMISGEKSYSAPSASVQPK